MNEPQFAREAKAYEAFTRLLVEAKHVEELFRSAGATAPPPLARMLGLRVGDVSKNGDLRPRSSVTPLESPDRPAEAGDNWIWIPAKDATPTSILLAQLRAQGGVVQSKIAIANVQKVKVGVNRGSIYNIVTRNLDTFIDRSEDGWKLKEGVNVPMISGDAIWGPPEVFGMYELAAHRRLVVIHVLRAFPGGLQIMQVLDQLQGDEMCRAPVTKDLIKVDMECLQKEGKVKRISNSKKWIATE